MVYGHVKNIIYAQFGNSNINLNAYRNIAANYYYLCSVFSSDYANMYLHKLIWMKVKFNYFI